MPSSSIPAHPTQISPGEPIPLSLEGVDQFGSPTYLIARFSDSRSDINLGAFSQAEGSNAVPASNNNNMVSCNSGAFSQAEGSNAVPASNNNNMVSCNSGAFSQAEGSNAVPASNNNMVVSCFSQAEGSNAVPASDVVSCLCQHSSWFTQHWDRQGSPFISKLCGGTAVCASSASGTGRARHSSLSCVVALLFVLHLLSASKAIMGA